MAKVNNVNVLRKLIREQLSTLSEGGHGGSLYYGQAPKLFDLLDEYSTSRKFSRPTIEMMNKFLNDLLNVSNLYVDSLGAYSNLDDLTSPINRARKILNRAHKIDPRMAAQFGGGVDLHLIEKQFFKALGADFNVAGEPASGFENIFGAGLYWQNVDRAAPAVSSIANDEEF